MIQAANASRTTALLKALTIADNGDGYATYLGGDGDDLGVGSHQLPNGDVILVMQTESAGLPTTDGAVKMELTGASDAYITRFNPESGEIIWASYFGDDDQDWVFGMDCDDEARTCGFSGTRLLPEGGLKAYVAIFNQDGTPACSRVFSEGSGSVGNHYDDPPEDDDFDDAYDATTVDLEIGPVVFGLVQTARGDIDGAIWMVDESCETLQFWQTDIEVDDLFFLEVRLLLAFGRLDHRFDIPVGKTAAGAHADRLFSPGSKVLSGDRDQAVGVDRERDLDLWNAARRRR